MSKYTESSIKYHEGLEGVRARPVMYLGKRGDEMVMRAALEPIQNSYDEYAAGRNNFIHVIVENDVISVIDEGNGIPVGVHEKAGISTLTLVLTKLHAGGKFDDKAYKTSAGVHGCGVAATNAISSSFECWTFNQNAWWYQSFAKGVPTSKVSKVKPPNLKRGTMIRFTLDQSIVAVNKIRAKLDVKALYQYLKNLANLNKGLEVSYTVNGKTYTFLNKTGIVQVLNSITKPEADLLTKPIVYEDQSVSFAIQWIESDSTTFDSYVNSVRTKDGGTHEEEFMVGLTRALAPFKTKKDVYTPKDLKCGLYGVLNVRLSQTEYSSQVKDRLELQLNKLVSSTVQAALDSYFAKNQSAAKRIIKHANTIKKAKDEVSAVFKSMDKVKQKRGTTLLLPGVLVTASCPPHQRELYICEGESAFGTVKQARSATHQEVLRITGKFSNAMKTPLVKLLKSKSVLNILTAIQYQHDSKDPYQDLRVGSIYFLSDPDPDGKHINVLLASLIYKLLPGLYERHRVFVCNAPLFVAAYKGNTYYGDTFQQCLQSMPKGAPQHIIKRLKGWGECNPEMLEILAFNPDTRKVIELTAVKGQELAEFISLTSADTSARKRLLGV
jgi:DNA gyrase subunit B